MPLHVMEEANRCLGCKKPQCQQGCPISTPIPEVIRLLKAGDMDKAGRMLFENNPLTTVCALICNHEKQCEGHCVLNRKGAPVHFSVIEDYVSSAYASKMTQGPHPSNGVKVAVVGSGPAGITIAILMARYGYEVTIFEGRDKIGGILRYGIPAFRLPESVLDDVQYRHLEMKGIRIRPNTRIGEALSIDDLFRDGYQAIFLGTGVWKARTLGIRGESLGHVHYAIHYLASPEAYRLGERVIVIGAGNAAMDAARTALRHGSRQVTCFSLRRAISASDYEASYARLEGVGFKHNQKPVEITDQGVIFRATEETADGSLIEVEGSENLYPASSVLIAIGQGPQDVIARTTGGLETTPSGLLAADEDGHTSRPGVFASGDVVNGARTVVEAVAHSKRVAKAMHDYIQGMAEGATPGPGSP